MPDKYRKIRDALLKRGMSRKEAQRVAAATYNKQRPAGTPPVTRSYDKT